jgi:hypothetical protein
MHLRAHRRLVLDPVVVPEVDGAAVVDADVVDGLNLKAGVLKLRDVPSEGGGRVCAGEDVLGHEEAPAMGQR